jgi:hypothetical protein
VTLPAFNADGDLPSGLHRARLEDVIGRFGSRSGRRLILAQRLSRIHYLARSTEKLRRFIVFGSFITAKPEPNDIDIFMLMDDAFEVGVLAGEARLLFEHPVAQAHFGASVFFLRQCAAFGGEEATIAYWGTRRDGGIRGLVEVIEGDL